jgi:hypothetical protein
MRSPLWGKRWNLPLRNSKKEVPWPVNRPRTPPKATRKVFAGGAYKTAYWVSYGFVYSTVYLTELLPEDNSFRRGLEEGATDAQVKVHGEKTTKSPVPSPSSAKAKPKARSRGAKKPGAEKAPEADAATS